MIKYLMYDRSKNLGLYSIKGNIPWNRGIPRTEDEKKKISFGRKIAIKKYGHPKGMLGKKHSVESRNLISINSNTPEIKQRKIDGTKKYNESKRKTVVCKSCQKEFLVTPARSKTFVCCSYSCLGKYHRKSYKNIKDAIRCTGKYHEWRTSIYKRDNFTCQKCGKVGGRLECHHKIELSKIIGDIVDKSLDNVLQNKLIFDMDNGITLCKKCHIQTDTYGWKISHLKIK